LKQRFLRGHGDGNRPITRGALTVAYLLTEDRDLLRPLGTAMLEQAITEPPLAAIVRRVASASDRMSSLSSTISRARGSAIGSRSPAIAAISA